jgi:predicted GNAT family acetyltransferase
MFKYNKNLAYHSMYDQLPLVNNQVTQSFEMPIDGERAFIDYKKRRETYLLVHTEVPKDLRGQGIAAILVEKTFRYLEAKNLKMIPYCAYVQAYLKKHPEWHRLIGQ